MKIALIGYGKMGKAIEDIALERGHDISLIIQRTNPEALLPASLQRVDVAIEFTGPESAADHMQACFRAGVPVVCGSTGWNKDRAKVEAMCKAAQGALLYASNFSIGVNLFFELNKVLAAYMEKQPQYDVRLHEVHHTQKKDAPSGTAISLAEDILARLSRKKSWSSQWPAEEDVLYISSERTDPAPGTHTVSYHSEIDSIEITHTAHNRKGFALGAVLAAEFLAGKKGIYGMKEVLGF